MSASLSFRLKPGTYITCYSYRDKAPIIDIASAGVALNLYADNASDLTESDVDLARQLLSAAQAFLAEVERLAAAPAAASFVPIAGGQVRCTVCGATGYPGGRWHENCQAGHPHACPHCDRRFSTRQGVGVHASRCAATAVTT